MTDLCIPALNFLSPLVWSRLKNDLHELTQTNQLLKDEFQTLHLTLNATEKKLVDAQKENDQLIAQLMALKEQDVLRLNEENDSFKRRQADKIKMQLEEAANEHKTVHLGR